MSDALARSPWWTDHAAFADLVDRFVAAEITPNTALWYEAGAVDRDLWRRAGALGVIGPSVAERHGGSGLPRSFEALTCIGAGCRACCPARPLPR